MSILRIVLIAFVVVGLLVILALMLVSPKIVFIKSTAIADEYIRRREIEQRTIEAADWFGKTGLDDETERELPRYLRRELYEFLDDPKGLKASDLQYLGIHEDNRGKAHFWRMPDSRGEQVFAYVELDSAGNVHALGWGDWRPSAK